MSVASIYFSFPIRHLSAAGCRGSGQIEKLCLTRLVGACLSLCRELADSLRLALRRESVRSMVPLSWNNTQIMVHFLWNSTLFLWNITWAESKRVFYHNEMSTMQNIQTILWLWLCVKANNSLIIMNVINSILSIQFYNYNSKSYRGSSWALTQKQVH